MLTCLATPCLPHDAYGMVTCVYLSSDRRPYLDEIWLLANASLRKVPLNPGRYRCVQLFCKPANVRRADVHAAGL